MCKPPGFHLMKPKSDNGRGNDVRLERAEPESARRSATDTIETRVECVLGFLIMRGGAASRLKLGRIVRTRQHCEVGKLQKINRKRAAARQRDTLGTHT